MSRTTPAGVSPIEKKIGEMVRRIVEQFAPEKIILFGSHARGDADPDSDVDLLIVMPIKGSKRDRTIEIRKALAGMGLAKDVIVATPEEIEKYRNLVGTIIYPAVRKENFSMSGSAEIHRLARMWIEKLPATSPTAAGAPRRLDARIGGGSPVSRPARATTAREPAQGA
jgi:predicted nucleotidyltransferase